MSKEAMKLALEALAVKFSEGWHEGIKIDASDIMLLNDAAQSLAEQPAQQEPVACEWWEHTSPVTGIKDVQDWQLTEADKAAGWIEQPLYTSPPAQRTWVGLTDEEVIDIAGSFDYRYDVARAAEAKLKEKNT